MKKILIIVDYQNDFVTGSLGFEKAKTLDSKISNLLNDYLNGTVDGKTEDTYVFLTMDTHFDDYLKTEEGKNLPILHCKKDTKSWEVYGKTGILLKEYLNNNPQNKKVEFICKNTFGSNILMQKLQQMDKLQISNESKSNSDDTEQMNKAYYEHNIEEITLVGVVTNMCVISNAIISKTACTNSHIIVKKDLCASFDDKLHDMALEVMKNMHIEIK
ncbi:MAG: isochorismatase family protein [Eubacteriales bacterium]|nr:isochorismatase family protein [Eubacteriales bacterium]